MVRLLTAVLAAFLLVSVGCSSDGDPEPTPTATPVSAETYAEPGPLGVGVTTLELVDRSRPMAPNGDFAGSAERPIPVEVWYPAAATGAPEVRDAPLSGGPYPLIVFAHGFTASRVQSVQYTRHLASHGYVVVAPDYPASNGNAPGGPRLRAVIDQPADTSFVINEMLMRNDDPDGPFAGSIDEERIGMTGHSLGGLTTMMTVFGPMRDDRIDAALPISPPGCFFEQNVIGETSTPLMVMAGSEELIVDPTSMRKAYDLANPPKYFVELAGADHIKFADIDINDRDIGGTDIVTRTAGENLVPDALAIADSIGGSVATCVTREGPKGEEYITGDRQRELMRLFGALFFDAYLRDNSGARTLLQGDPAELAAEAAVEYR